MKYRLKDSVRTYIIEFIVIFSCLSLIYVCTHTTDIDEFNECIQQYGMDYCNKVVE